LKNSANFYALMLLVKQTFEL